MTVLLSVGSSPCNSKQEPEKAIFGQATHFLPIVPSILLKLENENMGRQNNLYYELFVLPNN